MWRIGATRERAELVEEPRVVPDGGVLLPLPLLRWLLTVGRRRGLQDFAINGGDGVDVVRRGVIASCCCCGGLDMGDGDD